MQEVFHSMQQQKHDMEHLHRHGTEQHGPLLVYHGQNEEVNVDSHVIQIIHGIQQLHHVKQIQEHKLVEETYHRMHMPKHQQHIHRHGMEMIGFQLSLGQYYYHFMI